MNKKDEFDFLMMQLNRCTDCPKMVQSRKEVLGKNHKPILPAGNLDAKIFIIGIAPGRAAINVKNSDTSRPFAYGSGKILRNILKKYNFENKVFISNILKCNTPADKRFLDCDVIKCVHYYLIKEIEIVKPRIIVVLGAQTRDYFNAYVKTKIDEKIKVVVLNHPAFFIHKPELLNVYENIWKHLISEVSENENFVGATA